MTKRPEEIALLAESGKLLAQVFSHLDQGRRTVRTEDDGWTVVTRDGQLSAQFEHTVAITGNGVRVLTLRPDEKKPMRGMASSRP